MSTVDKKLMGQMLRFAKTVVITSANAKEGASVSDCEKPGKRDAQYLRAIMERGLRTLPLEQRVLSEAALTSAHSTWAKCLLFASWAFGK